MQPDETHRVPIQPCNQASLSESLCDTALFVLLPQDVVGCSLISEIGGKS